MGFCLATSCGSAASAVAARDIDCARDGTTLARGRFVRVFDYLTTHACLLSDGKAFDLGSISEADGDMYKPFAVAGSMVAGTVQDPDLGASSIDVVDVRHRRVVRHIDGFPTALVVSASGWVAAIEDLDLTEAPAGSHQVVVNDGVRRILATNTNIAPKSLRLDGRKLSWLEVGRRRTVTIGHRPR